MRPLAFVPLLSLAVPTATATVTSRALDRSAMAVTVYNDGLWLVSAEMERGRRVARQPGERRPRTGRGR